MVKTEDVYQPVPVSAASQIGMQFAKSIVIVNTWDARFGLLHSTSWGREARDKVFAAEGADIAAKALGAEMSLKTNFSDFRRDFDAALFAQALALLKTIRNRSGCTPVQLQEAERILNAAGQGLRSGG